MIKSSLVVKDVFFVGLQVTNGILTDWNGIILKKLIAKGKESIVNQSNCNFLNFINFLKIFN